MGANRRTTLEALNERTYQLASTIGQLAVSKQQLYALVRIENVERPIHACMHASQSPKCSAAVPIQLHPSTNVACRVCPPGHLRCMVTIRTERQRQPNRDPSNQSTSSVLDGLQSKIKPEP